MCDAHVIQSSDIVIIVWNRASQKSCMVGVFLRYQVADLPVLPDLSQLDLGTVNTK